MPDAWAAARARWFVIAHAPQKINPAYLDGPYESPKPISLSAFFILATHRWIVGFQPIPFVLSVPQRRICHGAYQSRSQRNIKNGEREDQNLGNKSRDNRYQPCVLKEVSQDKEKQSRRNHRERIIKRMDETETVSEEEARGANQKQQPPATIVIKGTEAIACDIGALSLASAKRHALIALSALINELPGK